MHRLMRFGKGFLNSIEQAAASVGAAALFCNDSLYSKPVDFYWILYYESCKIWLIGIFMVPFFGVS